MFLTAGSFHGLNEGRGRGGVGVSMGRREERLFHLWFTPDSPPSSPGGGEGEGGGAAVDLLLLLLTQRQWPGCLSLSLVPLSFFSFFKVLFFFTTSSPLGAPGNSPGRRVRPLQVLAPPLAAGFPVAVFDYSSSSSFPRTQRAINRGLTQSVPV